MQGKKNAKESKNFSKEKSKTGDFSKFIRPEKKKKTANSEFEKYPSPFEKTGTKSKPALIKKNVSVANTEGNSEAGLMRLNKYIAHSGICSRRDADVLIQSGTIKVNGITVTELGYKINPGDSVTMDGQRLSNEKHQYVLLNKPKDFVTTTDDPENKRTVMQLVKNACKERIYPVGRLDVKTTGLLLFTNDGEMAKKLTHPKHNISKIYHVSLDKALSYSDLLKIRNGVDLEDGFIKADEIDYVTSVDDKKEIGIQIHSGKNRIVRRIFEKLEYKVLKLDRVVFAGLTKKDLPRGKWRFLTPKEIDFLKML